MVGTTELARELSIRQGRLNELLLNKFPKDQRPGRGKRWSWTREEADALKSEFAPLIHPDWIIHYDRLLSDEELTALVPQFADRGPVQLPEGVDAHDTLKRLRKLPGLREVHIAEETELDGVILHA